MDFDLVLITKMKHGDEKAFDVFVRKHYEEILKYCCYHCLDASYAEDLTQETFLHFFRNLSDFRYMGKTQNYLYTIAGNLCRDFHKKPKEYLAEEQSVDIQKDLQQSETEGIINRITIEEALRLLPEELREVIVLRYFQELKLTEISEMLQISLSLVKYRIKQGKRQLEKLLREE